MSKYVDSEKLIAELTRMQFDLNAAYRHPQSDSIVRAISLEYDDILSLVDSLQQDQPEVELENYISNKLRELGADLINHKPYSFNHGLNVGKTNAYHDILDRLNARKK